MKFRKEFDSLGKINVRTDKYWGASTQRSIKFFNIGNIFTKPSIIKSIAIIKKSAANCCSTVSEMPSLARSFTISKKRNPEILKSSLSVK